MGEILLYIAVILLLIFANALFSMSEMALFASSKAKLMAMRDERKRGAAAALRLLDEPDHFLSVVQVGITSIAILSGAFGGDILSDHITPYLDPLLGEYSKAASFAMVVVALSYLSLILGELLPKRIAINHPEAIACHIAPFMVMVMKILDPLVKLLSISLKMVMKLFGIKQNNEKAVTEDEIKIIVEQSTQAGVLEEAEQQMINRIFRMGDMQIASIMTPRKKITWLNIKDEIQENIKKINECHHSHYPIADGDLENILGVARSKDLLAKAMENPDLLLKEVLIEPIYVPETMKVLTLLESFKKNGFHMAFILNEYGGFEGVVTLFDILESVFGEVSSIAEPEERKVVKREDGSMLVDGMVTIEELKELLSVKTLPEEEESEFRTLAGFAISIFGKLPEIGDKFTAEGYEFEVMDLDGKRIDRFLISKIARTNSGT